MPIAAWTPSVYAVKVEETTPRVRKSKNERKSIEVLSSRNHTRCSRTVAMHMYLSSMSQDLSMFYIYLDRSKAKRLKNDIPRASHFQRLIQASFSIVYVLQILNPRLHLRLDSSSPLFSFPAVAAFFDQENGYVK